MFIIQALVTRSQQNVSLHQFEEQPVEKLFPELQQLTSKLVWIQSSLCTG